MQYQVLLQKPSEQHFTASVVGLPNVVADGKTEKEAISNVRLALKAQLTTAKLITIEVSSELISEVRANGGQSLPKSIGIANSDRGDLSERVDEFLWQDL